MPAKNVFMYNMIFIYYFIIVINENFRTTQNLL